MKKIYLIDDNQIKGQKEYNASFVQDGTYDDVLVYIDKIDLKNIDEKSEEISNAKCIMIHGSFEDYAEGHYIDGSRNIYTKIIEEISDFGEKIPLVVFSGTFNSAEAVIDEQCKCILHLKKQLFYERLKDFLDYCRKNPEIIELRILAYGKNYKKIEALKYARNILNDVSPKEDSQFISSSEANNLKSFRDLINFSDLQCTYDDIINDIEDNPITVCVFRNRINKIINSFNKYGKNIYPWK